MPSTPAPNAVGQYAPGQYAPGQVPVMDQPPTTTDYPPADYYDYGTAYPGYYWNGDVWAWGLYPAFGLGLGWWGPGWGYGYGHYGRGYYGHGGYGGRISGGGHGDGAVHGSGSSTHGR
jgi:hypothetical protein